MTWFQRLRWSIVVSTLIENIIIGSFYWRSAGYTSKGEIIVLILGLSLIEGAVNYFVFIPYFITSFMVWGGTALPNFYLTGRAYPVYGILLLILPFVLLGLSYFTVITDEVKARAFYRNIERYEREWHKW